MTVQAGLGLGARTVLAALVLGPCGASAPSKPFVDFLVAVTDETFVQRASDPHGRPSYVEEHVEDVLEIGYCPWSGRIVGVKP